jgi:putative SOS response-associated peptidase YedK
VPADAFIEGTIKERLSKPYVVYLKNQERPFAFAGIWDTWVNKETGEMLNSFAIITTVANEFLMKLPHHRSPVILPRRYESDWLNSELPLSDITSLLNPYPSDLMNGYPIDPGIKNPRADGRELIRPVGERIEKEYEVKKTDDVKLQGMGANKRNREEDFLL